MTKINNNIEKIPINGHYVWVDKSASIKEGDFNVPSDFSKLTDIYVTTKDCLPIVNDKFNGYMKVVAASPELNLEGVPTYVDLGATSTTNNK